MNFDVIKDRLEFARSGIQNLEFTLANLISENKEVILRLNQDQLLAGRNIDNELLSPRYSNDPYFTSPESAANYQRFKESISSGINSRIYSNIYPAKPLGVPNLIITGSFQDGMYIQTGSTAFMVESSFMKADAIQTKYNYKLFGLSGPSSEYFFYYFLQDGLRKTLIPE